MSIDNRAKQYGEIFGSWRIGERIHSGFGGKTEVFLLKRSHVDWEEESVLKVITIFERSGTENTLSKEYKNAYLEEKKELCKKAEEEVRYMAKLSESPYIVRYLDFQFFDWEEERSFGCDLLIRMERLDTLRTLISQGNSYTEQDVIQIGKEICQALVQCYKESIVHRDIKPENIFRNSYGTYKLGDFGIARMIEESQKASTMTGTPEYAAPEQVNHNISQTYDYRVDIYSLGLTLYELLNENRLPFASSVSVKKEEVILRIKGKQLEMPSKASEELGQVILKACAYDPRDRYQSAQEFLNALVIVEKQEKSGKIQKKPQLKQKENSGKDLYPTLPATAQNQEKKEDLQEIQWEWEEEKREKITEKKTWFQKLFGRQLEVQLDNKLEKNRTVKLEDILKYKVKKDGTIEITGIKNRGILTLIIPEKIQEMEVTSIGDKAFSGYFSLKTISIPNSVVSIGNNVFQDCSDLTEIIIGQDNKNYSLKDGVLYSKDGSVLLHMPSGKYIREYIVPNSVTNIGNGAFSGCNKLKTISIPNNVTSIGDEAFLGCSGLSNINIPNSVTSIGDRAFVACDKLETIGIPDNVTSIGNSVFADCNSLKEIIIGRDNKKYCSKDGVLYSKDESVLLCMPKGKYIREYIISSSVTSIGDSAFSGCSSLKTISIPSSVISIGDSAFRECFSLETISIPSSVISIGDSAFRGCSSLKTISIPSNVISIGDSAFIGCSSLETISILSSVTSIGDSVFAGCSCLKEIIIRQDNKNYSLKDGVLYSKDESVLLCMPKGKYIREYIISSSVTSIGDSAFMECFSLETISIPSSVTSIGDSAFSHCFNLININIPNSVASIGHNAFAHCNKLTTISIPSSVTSIEEKVFYGCDSLININIPNSVISIEDEAFLCCKELKTINISNSVMSIGENVFTGCNNLTEIIIGQDNEQYCSKDGVLYSKDESILLCVPEGKNIRKYIISNGVTHIGNEAFHGCKKLTTISIPSSVTSIGISAFSYCFNLININIPNSVTNIGNRAFSNCRKLKTINIPHSVTSIGDSAFYDCWSLKIISIPSSITSIGARAFKDCFSLKTISIPSSVTSIGDDVFSGCDNLTIFVEKDSYVAQWIIKEGLSSKINIRYYIPKS